jgi:hypothetical protein
MIQYLFSAKTTGKVTAMPTGRAKTTTTMAISTMRARHMPRLVGSSRPAGDPRWRNHAMKFTRLQSPINLE